MMCLAGDFADLAGQRGVQDRAQRIRGGLGHELARRDPVAGFHLGLAGRAGALLERQHQPARFEAARPRTARAGRIDAR